MACLKCYTSLEAIVQQLRQLRWIIVILLASLLSACGGDLPDIAPTNLEADVVLFERGNNALAEEDWSRAREYFEQIRDNYPQSQFRANARLLIAQSYQAESSAISSAAALAELREFLRLYPPTHELSSRAQYMLATVYFDQMRRPERDQSQTRYAIEELETFITQYGGTADADLLNDVRIKLREALDRISESSFIVGRFYYRNKHYVGAIQRFRSILEQDPGYTQRENVYYYLADSLAETDRAGEALSMFEQLLTEYPETVYREETGQKIAELDSALDVEDRQR